MADTDATPDPLLVACLCAAWCHVCEAYRATFDALAREFGPAARFVWVDIEDDEDTLGPIDVDDFPTLLIARGGAIHHFATVVPTAQAAHRLLRRALKGQLPVIADSRLAGLPERLGKG
jgi:thiol-disulfide isomerase/thioredoxin